MVLRAVAPLAVVSGFAIFGAACAGGGRNSDARTPAGPASTSTELSIGLTPDATRRAPILEAPAGASQEVTGIVGSVNRQTRVIEITRLAGAPVRQIAVDDRTVIRRATGGTTTLADIRPSNRIVARGLVASSGDALFATEIVVQNALSGGQPGG